MFSKCKSPISLRTLAPALRSSTSHELMEFLGACCAHLEEADEQVQAFLPEKNRLERVLEEGRRLLEKHPEPAQRPPLFGVPFGVKDIFHAQGFLTRAGSQIPPERLAGREGPVVRRLCAAGGIVLGKTVTTEFAFFTPGPTRNPHNFRHTPGGSSSGSAAAVGGGLCSLALGTQTIGSIARPASYCGAVGFKPSYERISREGVIPFSETADHVGFFVGDVPSVSLVAALLCDGWRVDRCVPSRKPKLGVPVGAFLSQANEEMMTAFSASLESLSAAGYDILSVNPFADLERLNTVHRRLVAAELAAVHRHWFGEFGHLYGKATRELIELGRSVGAEELSEARLSCIKTRGFLDEMMLREEIDLWISPSACDAAPHGLDSTGSPLMNLPWTHAGMPTITIPMPRTASELPLGFQMAARFGDDERLCAWGAELAGKINRP